MVTNKISHKLFCNLMKKHYTLLDILYTCQVLSRVFCSAGPELKKFLVIYYKCSIIYPTK